ncbi:MAG: protein translocase subunit SecD, partial [Verrucomicrobiota bacterium]
MNRSHLFKLLFTAFVAVWAATEIYPPGARNLLDQFDKSAALNPDQSLDTILKRARELETQLPGNTMSNLLAAVGTNDLRKYFPTNYVDFNQNANPNRLILNRIEREAAGKFNLGIDLQGGTAFVLEIDTSKLGSNSVVQAIGQSAFVEQAIGVIRKRVDNMGVSEPVIQPAGENRILVQLPGLKESAKDSARQRIQKAAFLEFRLVDPRLEEHLQSGLIPAGHERLWESRVDKRTGQRFQNPLLVKRKPELAGTEVDRAGVSLNPMTGKPEILFGLKSEGARIFAQVTRANIGNRLAIVLDGEVISAPTINSEIPGGSGQITGDFDMKEALDLASALENPLAAPLRIVEERGVDPSLGKDTVASGIKACIFAVAVVALFMLVYYLTAGVVANVAMVLNILLLLGVMCSLDVTFTLPGIAGIVLTVGMAVDANVLIYERMREELHAGKSVRGAVAAGYDKAFGTILDSNLTTLISSILLILLGTGPVKGFGVALTIGLTVSMFTAL